MDVDENEGESMEKTLINYEQLNINLTDYARFNEQAMLLFKHNLIRMGLCSALLALGAYGNVRGLRRVWQKRDASAAAWRKSALRMSLLFADCLIVFVFLPSEIGWIYFDSWYAGDAGCKIVMAMRMIGFFAMSSSIAGIAFDRMLYAKSAVLYHLWQKRVLWIAFGLWMLSALLSMPNMFLYELKNNHCVHIYSYREEQGESTMIPEVLSLISILFMFWLPLTGMLLAYGTITHMVYVSLVEDSDSNQSRRSRSIVKRKKQLSVRRLSESVENGYQKVVAMDRTSNARPRTSCSRSVKFENKRQRSMFGLYCCWDVIAPKRRQSKGSIRQQQQQQSTANGLKADKKRLVAQGQAWRLASVIVIPYIVYWTDTLSLTLCSRLNPTTTTSTTTVNSQWAQGGQETTGSAGESLASGLSHRSIRQQQQHQQQQSTASGLKAAKKRLVVQGKAWRLASVIVIPYIVYWELYHVPYVPGSIPQQQQQQQSTASGLKAAKKRLVVQGKAWRLASVIVIPYIVYWELYHVPYVPGSIRQQQQQQSTASGLKAAKKRLVVQGKAWRLALVIVIPYIVYWELYHVPYVPGSIRQQQQQQSTASGLKAAKKRLVVQGKAWRLASVIVIPYIVYWELYHVPYVPGSIPQQQQQQSTASGLKAAKKRLVAQGKAWRSIRQQQQHQQQQSTASGLKAAKKRLVVQGKAWRLASVIVIPYIVYWELYHVPYVPGSIRQQQQQQSTASGLKAAKKRLVVQGKAWRLASVIVIPYIVYWELYHVPYVPGSIRQQQQQQSTASGLKAAKKRLVVQGKAWRLASVIVIPYIVYWELYHVPYVPGSIRQQQQQQQQSTASGLKAAKKRLVAQGKAWRLASVIVIPYIVCWTPYQALLIWKLLDPGFHQTLGHSAIPIALIWAVTNACLNPYIYYPLEF